MTMQNKHPLYVYVIGVAVVWAIILGIVWHIGNMETFGKFVSVCAGFVLGMIAMYIAVHIYRWK